jgi:hypothetical protein
MNEQLIGGIAGLVAGGVYAAFHNWDRRRHTKTAWAGKVPLPVSPLGMVARWAFVALVAFAVLKVAPEGKLWFAGVFAGIFTIYLIWDISRGLTKKK